MCYKYFSFLLLLGFLNAQDLPLANWKNVDYAGDNQIYHMMDIYLPQGDQKTYPVVLTIYGSAWRSNKNKATKYIKKTLIKPLLNSGFAVVSINHRSSSDAIFPAQIHDVKAAIRFIRAHAKSYQFTQILLELQVLHQVDTSPQWRAPPHGINLWRVKSDNIWNSLVM